MSEQTLSSNHPLIPPTTEDERASLLRLLRSRRVGIATFYRLLAGHGSADAALRVLPEIASNAGVSKYEPCSNQLVISEMRAAERAGAQMICRGETSYPALLAEIPDAPHYYGPAETMLCSNVR